MSTEYKSKFLIWAIINNEDIITEMKSKMLLLLKMIIKIINLWTMIMVVALSEIENLMYFWKNSYESIIVINFV